MQLTVDVSAEVVDGGHGFLLAEELVKVLLIVCGAATPVQDVLYAVRRHSQLLFPAST